MVEVRMPKPGGGGCRCPVGGYTPGCYHHDPARKEERSANARRGGHQKQYNKRSRETARYKRYLIDVAAEVHKGDMTPEELKAIKGAYDTIAVFHRIESEDYRQYVLLPELLEHEHGESGPT